MEKKNQVDPINIYRIIAVVCVFFLHTSIFSGQLGFAYSEENWFLQTPAWAAVWLFYLLSGYLIGKGFISGRYKENGQYTLKSVLNFYINRFLKVGLPTWIFSFLAIILQDPAFGVNNKAVFFKILTFRYYNAPSSTIIGATWYVSTLMWLYLFAPFFAFLIEKVFGLLTKRKYQNLYVSMLFFTILLLGLLLRIYCYKRGFDWSSRVYVPFYCNLDIYICGMLINCFSSIKNKKVVNIMSCTAFFFLVMTVILNSRIYYLGAYDTCYMILYQYVFPSVYIMIGAFYLYCFGNNKQYDYEKLSVKMLVRNPLRIIDWLSSISFEFYLMHSLVLNCIYLYISAASPLYLHLKLLASAFVVTVILAALFHSACQSLNVKL